MLRQPRVGYRAATDAVFLAAACPAQKGIKRCLGHEGVSPFARSVALA
ncbi:MAG: methyltransferase, partial [Pseudomonadota bacterium]